MLEMMDRLDNLVVGFFQRFYELILDRYGATIGTFRMSVAFFPVAADILLRLLQRGPLLDILLDFFCILGIGVFYNLKMMDVDDRLQASNKLALINARSLIFRQKFFFLRIFYMGCFGCGAVLNHHFGGLLGLFAIVNARCVVVRNRIERKKQMATPAFSTP